MSEKPILVSKNGIVFAHYIPAAHRPEGVNFMTPDDYSLQLGLIGHEKDHQIKDHIHNKDIKYQVNTTQEFLYLEYGQVEVTLYDYDWSIVEKIIMKKGDIILHVRGGHGFRVIEPCYMIEVKQGPFPGDKLMKIYRE